MRKPFHFRRSLLACLSLGAALGSCITAVQAAEWPTQPLTLVIGFSKGSVSEVLASTLSEPLGRLLGQPVTVETLTGKAGTNAAAKVAAATDGHTFGIVMGNTMTVARMVDASLSYDPERDLRPVAFMSDDPMVMMAPTGEPSANAVAFLSAARLAGEKWKFGSQGVGSVAHLGMEYLAMKAGLRPQHVPMAGGPEVVEAMRAGKVQIALLPATLAKRATREGGVKMVAQTSRDPSPALPGLASLHDAGVTGFDYRVWGVGVVPRKWPEANAARLEAALGKLLGDAEIRKRLAQAGVEVPRDVSAAQARREITHEMRVLGGIAAIRGVQAAPAR